MLKSHPSFERMNEKEKKNFKYLLYKKKKILSPLDDFM